VRHLLIAEMGDKCCRGETHGFIVPSVGFAELDDKAGEKEFAQRGNFRVDDGGEGGVYGCIGEGSSLSFHDGTTI